MYLPNYLLYYIHVLTYCSLVFLKTFYYIPAMLLNVDYAGWSPVRPGSGAFIDDVWLRGRKVSVWRHFYFTIYHFSSYFIMYTFYYVPATLLTFACAGWSSVRSILGVKCVSVIRSREK